MYSSQTLGDKLLYDPIIHSITSQNVLGVVKAETPAVPTFMYHSSSVCQFSQILCAFSAPSMLISHGQDEIIPYAAANKTAHAWCGFGAPITFVTDTGGPGHAGGYLNWNTLAIPWLNDRINGVPLPTKGCSFTSVKMGGLWFKRDDKSMII